MRQILIGDIIAVARSVLTLPRKDRMLAVATMLEQAHIADKVTKRTGRPHQLWGNGSLLAASASHPKATEPFLGDPEYLEALRTTLDQAILWKRNRQRSHPRQQIEGEDRKL